MFTRLALFTVLLSIFAAPVMAQSLSDEQKKEVEAIVQKVLMDNPQIILDSVQKHQEAEMLKQREDQQKGIDSFVKTLGKDLAPYTAGNPKGDITVVEFFDYNCGYCKKAFQEVLRLIEDDKNVHVIFFEMPILGPQSTAAAKWSMAAAKQKKYFDFHRAAMEFTGPKTEENLEKLAKDAGLDVEKAKKDKESADVTATIEKNINLAQELGFTGTPGFLIGNNPVFGYMEFPAMKAAVEMERSKSKKK